MVDTFRTGDRFAYTATGEKGVILSVQELAGTVRARYASRLHPMICLSRVTTFADGWAALLTQMMTVH